MNRCVQMILLCEDRQHETFARRFLEKSGWPTRRLRVVIAPRGRGSAEQFVRERFAIELAAYRSNRNRVAQGLIVVCDGDRLGVGGRIDDFADTCRAHGVAPRKADDRVALFVPTWNVETWLAYLSGSTVDEATTNYPRLKRPRDCQPHVDRLYEMCQQKSLRQPAPPSLEAACLEYQRLA